MAFRQLPFQAKFFKETVLNQAKTILYQPPDWANYVATMFLQAISRKNVDDQVIRLSPLIYTDSNISEDVKPLINKLYEMDMDLTNDSEIENLVECFDSWKMESY